jgi:hypothetical protein
VLAQFIEGNEKAAFTDSDKFFKNAEEFQQYVRAIKHTGLKYDKIQEIMKRLTGEQNSIIADITDEKNVKRYLDIFPFVKTLSKICHWAMTSQRDDHAALKIKNEQNELINQDAQAERNEEILKKIKDLEGSNNLLSYLSMEQKLVLTKKDRIVKAHAETKAKLDKLNETYFELN